MRKKPELLEVRVLPSEERNGFYELWCRYDDGITEGELWGTLAETEFAAAIRRRDIRWAPTARSAR